MIIDDITRKKCTIDCVVRFQARLSKPDAYWMKCRYEVLDVKRPLFYGINIAEYTIEKIIRGSCKFCKQQRVEKI